VLGVPGGTLSGTSAMSAGVQGRWYVWYESPAKALCAAADCEEIGQRRAVLRPADGALDLDQIVEANHANAQLLLRQ